ncbi:MAG: hypothetical protein ACRYG7_23695 [Janthinobacterium lividum]
MLHSNSLQSAALVSQLKGSYTICNPETVGSIADTQGAIHIAPPIESIVDDDYEQVDRYHAWFASFLETNHGVLAEYGADDLRIFMEIFYAKGHQCNLEIFDRETISTIGKFKVALPISIYALSEENLDKWAKEVKLTYSSL